MRFQTTWAKDQEKAVIKFYTEAAMDKAHNRTQVSQAARLCEPGAIRFSSSKVDLTFVIKV